MLPKSLPAAPAGHLSLAINLGLLVSLKFQLGPARHWMLPLALSFYAFQALTYTLDLYRRDAKGTKSYLAHLAAVSFFPTTLAGPITRVSDLLITNSTNRPCCDPSEGGRALFLIGLGLVKKLLIADYLGDNLVNRIFDFPRLYSGFEVLVGVYAYALELYYDFSGYTDIAIGSALLLGIKLPPNFDMPYAAETSPISGGAGTSAFPTGCATICIFRCPACARLENLHLPEPGDHHGAGRPVARRELELRDLGSAARRGPGRPAPGRHGAAAGPHPRIGRR